MAPSHSEVLGVFLLHVNRQQALPYHSICFETLKVLRGQDTTFGLQLKNSFLGQGYRVSQPSRLFI